MDLIKPKRVDTTCWESDWIYRDDVSAKGRLKWRCTKQRVSRYVVIYSVEAEQCTVSSSMLVVTLIVINLVERR